MPYIQLQIRRFVVVLYTAALLIVVTAIAVISSRAFSAGKAWVDHTTEVLAGIQAVQTTMLNAETGQRGYVITGDRSFLKPYSNALLIVNQQIGGLRSLVRDNPTQTARVDALDALIQKKLVEMGVVVTARDNEGFEAAMKIIAGRRGKTLMDQIRLMVLEISNQEHILMEKRLLRVDDAAVILSASLVLVVVRDLLVLMMIVYGIKGAGPLRAASPPEGVKRDV